MYTARTPEPLSFSNSLAGIMHKRSSEPVLPDAGSLVLAEAPEPSRLYTLLAVDNIDQFEALALRPDCRYPAPHEFASRLEKLQASLARLAETWPDLAEPSGGAGGEVARESTLRGLLEAFSKAVVAG
ncbi:MAG: hypothetical protein JWP36_2303 [Paucimonas sp.]|nr:hypothetical protein [Paucimonas sp.]